MGGNVRVFGLNLRIYLKKDAVMLRAVLTTVMKFCFLKIRGIPCEVEILLRSEEGLYSMELES